MNFDEYQKQAMATKSPTSGLITAVLGLCGEAGEVADYVKKVEYQGHPEDRRELIRELGDVLWYLALAADVLGVSLGEIAEANLAKLRGRYPNGFSAEASRTRKVELKIGVSSEGPVPHAWRFDSVQRSGRKYTCTACGVSDWITSNGNISQLYRGKTCPGSPAMSEEASLARSEGERIRCKLADMPDDWD